MTMENTEFDDRLLRLLDLCRTARPGVQAGKDLKWQESGQTALALRPGVAQHPRKAT